MPPLIRRYRFRFSGNKRPDGRAKMFKNDGIFALEILAVGHQCQVVVENGNEEVHDDDDHEEQVEQKVVTGTRTIHRDETTEVEFSEKGGD